MHRNPPIFDNAPSISPIHHVVPRMVALAPNDAIYMSGSCVRIAKNIYLTAKHVMLDLVEKFQDGLGRPNFTIWAIHIYPGPIYSIWQMDKFWVSSFSDLAIFHTKPLNEIAAGEDAVNVAILDLHQPKIGTRVSGFGFHKPNVRIEIDKNDVRNIKVDATGSTTVGTVLDVHYSKRDPVMLPFPCYLVNARFEPSMSGGPIFNDEGCVCGIICSSFELNESAAQHISYAAALWPLMELQIDIGIDGKPVDKRYPLLELAKKAVITAKGHEKVRIERDSDTTVGQISFEDFN